MSTQLTISDEAREAEKAIGDELAKIINSDYTLEVKPASYFVQLAINSATEKLKEEFEAGAKEFTHANLDQAKTIRELQKHLTALREALMDTVVKLKLHDGCSRYNLDDATLIRDVDNLLSSTPAELQKMFVRRETHIAALESVPCHCIGYRTGQVEICTRCKALAIAKQELEEK